MRRHPCPTAATVDEEEEEAVGLEEEGEEAVEEDGEITIKQEKTRNKPSYWSRPQDTSPFSQFKKNKNQDLSHLLPAGILLTMILVGVQLID